MTNSDTEEMIKALELENATMKEYLQKLQEENDRLVADALSGRKVKQSKKEVHRAAEIGANMAFRYSVKLIELRYWVTDRALWQGALSCMKMASLRLGNHSCS